MTSYVTPKKNTEFIFYTSLVSQADTKLLQANPTLASGDVKVSIDGGALANLGTLPSVAPASSVNVKVTLSADEMNGDNISVIFRDAAGAEWCDHFVAIQTTANQIDDLAKTGADGDTLETLSDQIDLTATASALTTVDTVVDAIKAVTDNLPNSGALNDLAAILVDTGTDIPALINALNDLSSSDVQTAANAALVANHLDHLLAATYDPASKPGTADALLNELIGNDSGVSQFTANALELAPSGGEGLAAAVWASPARTLTQGAASVVAAVTGSSITVYRGTTWSISLTNIGNISTYDTIYLSVKADDKPEAAAILRVYNDASGLLWFNGAAVTTATNGTITIDDAPTGDITITVLEAETQNAPTGIFVYDIKGIDDNGQVNLLSSGGKFQILPDITRAITSP